MRLRIAEIVSSSLDVVFVTATLVINGVDLLSGRPPTNVRAVFFTQC